MPHNLNVEAQALPQAVQSLLAHEDALQRALAEDAHYLAPAPRSSIGGPILEVVEGAHND